MASSNRPSWQSRNPTLLTVAIVVAALYLARKVFIPLALAMLISFLMVNARPLVKAATSIPDRLLRKRVAHPRYALPR